MAQDAGKCGVDHSGGRAPDKEGPITTVSLETADIKAARAATRRERLEWWTDLLAVVIMVTATVAASWSGCQAARWGGVQSIHFAEASGKKVE